MHEKNFYFALLNCQTGTVFTTGGLTLSCIAVATTGKEGELPIIS